jgi:hypothetical protein
MKATIINFLNVFCVKVVVYFNFNKLRPGLFAFKKIYLASSCYDLEFASGRSMVITVQIKLLEAE